MNIDLDAIQARADAATEGPWRLWVAGNAPANHRQAAVESAWAYDEEGLDTEMITDWCETPDADFIANARTDVPALLALVREQAAKLEAIHQLADGYGRVGFRVTTNAIRAALTATEAKPRA